MNRQNMSVAHHAYNLKLPSSKYLYLSYSLIMQSQARKFGLRDFKRVFKNEDSRFILSVGLKISLISLIITFVIYWFLFQIIRLNYAFFKSHGFPRFSTGGFSYSYFYDIVISEAVESIPYVLGFHICLFFIGSYLGWLILRPFKIIGDYAETVIENPNVVFRVDEFSTYKLLTRFSEFFFEYLRDSRKVGTIAPHSVPPQYSRIHQPVPDRIFMLHFGLLLVVISIVSAVFIIENSSSVFLSMTELATKTLRDQKTVTQYFASQMFILDEILWITIILISTGYILLGFHLYAKVAGPAFGIFSTMRSFMKGNYSSRVHMLGFPYVREYTRKLNKYLDYIETSLTKNDSKN